MKKLALLIFFNLILLLPGVVSADLVVIANLKCGVEKLSKDEVTNLYMGRDKKLASGITAIPVDLLNPLTEKAQFYKLFTGKDLQDINSYRARLMFSGQAMPPIQAASMDEVLEIVSVNTGAIGYIDRKKLDNRVKLIFDPSR
ncbi:MAG: hypothetical protein KGM99_06200 [Burkholderiales bacterium]|nr:hypothetical protein [Burkholderiales bacterium]